MEGQARRVMTNTLLEKDAELAYRHTKPKQSLSKAGAREAHARWSAGFVTYSSNSCATTALFGLARWRRRGVVKQHVTREPGWSFDSRDAAVVENT